MFLFAWAKTLCTARRRQHRTGSMSFETLHSRLCLAQGLTALMTCRCERAEQLWPPLYLAAVVTNITFAHDLSLPALFRFKTVKCWLTVAARLNWSPGRRGLWEVTSEKYDLAPKIMWSSSLKYCRNGFSCPCSVLYMPLIICSQANECRILFWLSFSYTAQRLQILTRAAIVH